jgi:hypothetical protein
MNKLSERNKLLLLQGSKQSGTMVGGFSYVEEQLYCDEAHELLEFCKWVDKEIGGVGSANIDILFRAFKYPENKQYQTEALVVKNRIAEIRRY